MATSVYSPFTGISVYSCRGFLSGMLYVRNIRAKYVLQFSRSDDLQNTLLDLAIENRRIVWTCLFEAAGSKGEESISYNYRFHIVTHYKS